MMSVNNMDKLIAQINTVVSGLDIQREDKLSLLVLLTEIGYEFKKTSDAIEELVKDRDMYAKAMTDEHNRTARLEWDHRWIPVTERLPEENGRYLALYPLKTKPSVWRHKVYDFAKDLVEVDKFEFNEHKSGFYGNDAEYGYYEDKDVTHWMPLPQPPESEDEQS